MSTLTHDDVAVDLVINKLTRQQYNEISGSLSPYELYLIDDVDFDVFDKKIIHVLNPTNDNDAVNKIYMENACILTSNISSYVDKYVYRIKTNDNEHAISSDAYIYDKKWGDNDWVVQILDGSDVVSPSDVSFYYKSATGTGQGWVIIVKGVSIETGITDIKSEEITGSTTISGKRVVIKAIRDCWKAVDKLIRASEVMSELSGITSGSSASEIGQAIENLCKKIKLN